MILRISIRNGLNLSQIKHIKKPPNKEVPSLNWWRGGDLNFRPSGYEPDELPDCSTPRHTYSIHPQWNFTYIY